MLYENLRLQKERGVINGVSIPELSFKTDDSGLMIINQIRRSL